MNSSPSPCKGSIRAFAHEIGATACGFAKAENVDIAEQKAYSQWIADGCHGTMDYCERYTDVRFDPRLLLEGAKTVISCAFNYYNQDSSLPLAPHIARYAWGLDYHWVVKSRLTILGEYLTQNYGGAYRVCVDSAPIRERYWAQKSGIGFIGQNGQLILPGRGSYFFLGEVIWTEAVEPDEPCTLSCDNCRAHMAEGYKPEACVRKGACVKACPGGALDGSGHCDARRCLSYLTIEHRGPLPQDTKLGNTIYGCDVCQRVCPHNAHATPTNIPEFAPYAELLSLAPADFAAMSSSRFRKLTARSAMSRIPLKQMIRNIGCR